ncbi:MAG: carboxypeptidase-like regulatory domain-containing protein, partial [Bacteroidales bacterium]|nr:carboxypeptidase-like regulatory domain-containing protein [Bacteroidales bacterium]
MNKIRKTNREGIRNALCILAVLLFLQCSLVENLASQTLSGKVFTVEVGGDTVPVYMARLQWLHTAVGAHTKKDGSYQLPFSRTDTLIVSYSFYKADTLVVSPEESQRDFFINTSQALQEVVISKKRQKYVRKGNPAIELVKQVIEHKNDNRIESIESFRTTKYKKLVMAFGPFDIDLQKNRFRRQFSFLEKYIDTIPNDTVPALTISLRETLSDRYYRKSPHRDVTFVKARRMQGVDEVFDDEGLGTDLNAIFSDVNIFDNDIDLMLNKFVSPL